MDEPRSEIEPPVLTPHEAFQIADYLCSALGPLVKASVQNDLIALKFYLWDAHKADQFGGSGGSDG